MTIIIGTFIIKNHILLINNNKNVDILNIMKN